MKYIFTAAAQDDVSRAYRYYLAHGGIAISSAFADEAQRIVELIASNPNLGTLLTKRFRVFPLRSYPFRVIYQSFPDHVRIVAIAHTKRKPTYWRARR